jgi:lysophospholipase L1-like esterase
MDNLSYGVWLYSVIEIFILLTDVGKVSNEDQKGQYNAFYETKNASYYHVWKVASRHWLSNNEFHYDRMSNSLGFADREWEKEKPEGTYRILCLGDSFTEGDGADADSTYPVFLESMMKERYGAVEVLNAGTCGSDPYFNYINFKDRLQKYQPDLIIQTISANDLLHDIPVRGGLERFKENGRLEYANAPWWEPLYALSYVFRILVSVMGYNADLTKNALIYNNLDNYISEVKNMFTDQFAPICKEQGAQLVVVYLPMKSELENSSPDIVRLKMNNFSTDSGFVYKDLHPYYMRNLSTQGGLPVRDYYWKYDAHHNAKGYQLMAKSIFDAIQPLLPDSLKMSAL